MTDPANDRFAILLDGDLHPTERVRRQIAGCRVIAADGGIRHAAGLGLEPELWVGDFDSAGPELAERYAGVPRRDFPAEKDVSDGQLAILEAQAMGAKHFVLVGALGGSRSDHTFMNLAVAAGLHSNETRFILTSGAEEALPVLPGEILRPDWTSGTIFSLACFSAVGGLTINGAKWPLDAVQVPFGSTFTLSNVVEGVLAIEFKTGCAVALAQLG